MHAESYVAVAERRLKMYDGLTEGDSECADLECCGDYVECDLDSGAVHDGEQLMPGGDQLQW